MEHLRGRPKRDPWCVATLAYAPYCIFNWVSPLMTMLVAGLGWNIRKDKAASDTSA